MQQRRSRDVSNFAAEVQRMHPSLRYCFAVDKSPHESIVLLAEAVGYPHKIEPTDKVAETCQKLWPYVLEYKS